MLGPTPRIMRHSALLLLCPCWCSAFDNRIISTHLACGSPTSRRNYKAHASRIASRLYRECVLQIASRLPRECEGRFAALAMTFSAEFGSWRIASLRSQLVPEVPPVLVSQAIRFKRIDFVKQRFAVYDAMKCHPSHCCTVSAFDKLIYKRHPACGSPTSRRSHQSHAPIVGSRLPREFEGRFAALAMTFSAEF
jgi:hypothetical protein